MRTFAEHLGMVYLPIAAALVAWIAEGRRRRIFAACLLSLLWAAPALLIVQRLNAMAGWWHYDSKGPHLAGVPLDAYAGWLVLWGVVPQLAFPRLAIAWTMVVMMAADLLAMPLCTATLHLGPHWLVGEAVAAAVVLLPALAVARWTERRTHLYGRVALQLVTSAGVFLYLVPEVVFSVGERGWVVLLDMPRCELQILLQVMILMALPAISAAFEFAERGRGTPIPYDPPERLVTSGIYRYLANPMQTSCTLVMLVWAGALRNEWLTVAAVVALAYSAGIAWWDEREDLWMRFGAAWRDYRTEVRNWLPRWRPYHAGPAAVLYLAESCAVCSSLWRWVDAQRPIGLEIRAAETLAGTIRRMRYDAGDGSAPVDGVRALGRVLEHIHLGWALAGMALRLPGVWRGTQLLADASGAGPRRLPQRCASPRA